MIKIDIKEYDDKIDMKSIKPGTVFSGKLNGASTTGIWLKTAGGRVYLSSTAGVFPYFSDEYNEFIREFKELNCVIS